MSVSVTLAGLMLAVITMGTLPDTVMGIAAVVAVAIISPKVSLRAWLVRIRPFGYFAVITLLFGGLGGDEIAFRLGPVAWGYDALERATIAALRLVALGGAISWVALAVGTSALVSGLWTLNRKVRRWGWDMSPLLVGTAVALRFLPLLHEEAVALRRAWQARGADLLSRGPLGRVQYTVGLIIPILAAALRRAEAYATAMQLRVGTDQVGHTMSGGLGNAFSPVEKDATPNHAATRTRPSELLAVVVAWIPIAFKIVTFAG